LPSWLGEVIEIGLPKQTVFGRCIGPGNRIRKSFALTIKYRLKDRADRFFRAERMNDLPRTKV